VYEVNFGGDFVFQLRFDSEKSMTFTRMVGKFKGFTEAEAITVTLRAL